VRRGTRPSLHVMQLVGTLLSLLVGALCYISLCLRSPTALAAENLFLRKQLAVYREGGIKPRRATHTTRMALMVLARWFDWRQALIIVQPATLIRWHGEGFRRFWRWTSRHGRPPIPADLQVLIRRMARDNPTWGEERIANELRLSLGCACRRARYGSICPCIGTVVEANARSPNAGGPLSAIMPRQSSPVTSARWSRRPFASSTSLWSWNTRLAEFSMPM
jgi:hypothetical protein